jgi:hypothetical protein
MWISPTIGALPAPMSSGAKRAPPPTAGRPHGRVAQAAETLPSGLRIMLQLEVNFLVWSMVKKLLTPKISDIFLI